MTTYNYTRPNATRYDIKLASAVTPGDVLTIEVAGGGQGAMRTANGGAGGWPDGGPGGRGDAGSGGGGGSTRFYINGALKAVAGGGGGSGGYSGNAGAGGSRTAQAAEIGGGTGASGTAGGVDESAPTVANKTGRSLVAFPGAQRLGGWGSSNGNNTVTSSDDGGGGGGGYWGGGGGGGDGQSGGGGSSWIDASATALEDLGGNRHVPAKTPAGLPAIATGVNSGSNGPAVPGGDGYAIVNLR